VGKVSMMAKLVAQQGRGEELMASFEELFAQVETEPGTEIYALNRAGNDPDTFWFYEVYSDEEAASRHAGSEVMQRAQRSMGSLLASADLVMGALVRAKGIDTA
jgi:quinol monooxygenase YgiN